MSVVVEQVRPPKVVDAGSTRVDGCEKVSGQARYAGDLRFPGMLYGATVRSPYAHARIRAIRAEEARSLPGVHAVLTGEDIPYGTFGRMVHDTPALARGVVRYIGERVAAVAAETPEIAEQAAALIEVDYEPLPAVLDAEEALQPDAPRVHEAAWKYPGAVVAADDPPNLQSRLAASHGGDVEAALAASYRVFEHTFRTPAEHAGYLEPHTVVARVTDTGVDVWASNKGPYRLREQLARWLGRDAAEVRVHPILVGGDFGGKGSPMDIPLCVVLAERTGRPVRMRMRYAEELLAAGSRHPATVRVRLGVDREHRITALHVRAVMDGGAYAGYKPMAGANLPGVTEGGNCYRIPVTLVESLIAYTHTAPKGHMRSPGSLQTVFAVESLMDEAARELGMDPVEFRRINMLRDGEPGHLGTEWVEFRGEATLQAALEAVAATPWPERDRGAGRAGSGDDPWAYGTGIAFYSRDTHGMPTEVAVEPHEDGSITVWVPFPEQGAGQLTVVHRAVRQSLGLDPELIRVRQAPLDAIDWDGGVGGSRITADGSEAVANAVAALRERLEREEGLSRNADGEEIRGAVAAFAKRTGSVLIRGKADHRDARPVTSVCVQIARVRVDRETGQVVVDDIFTAADVAAILNRRAFMGQVEGGIVMGYGAAVLEDLLYEDGRATTGNLGEYKIPSPNDIPRLHVALVEGGRGLGRLNVKGIGELTNVAVAPAIANAVADAVGVRIDQLPITAEKVYFALHGKEAGR